MNRIKELTAHIRRLAEKGYIVDYNTPNELNNVLNQIDIASELMKPTDRYKTLMYAGNYIDTSRLYQGIYSTNIPHLYPSDYTIEHLLESNKKIQETIGKSNIPDSYFENIEQCKLVDIYIAKGHNESPPTPTWIEIKSEDDLPKDDKNVLVIIEGQMQIMCLCSIIDNDVYSKVWCMVYDGLDGDGIYDDNYYPTHWMPLPTHPQTTTTK